VVHVANLAGGPAEGGRAIKVRLTIGAMVREAFGTIDLSGNLPRGTTDGRVSESAAGTCHSL